MKPSNRVDSHKPKRATVNPDPVLTPDEATDHIIGPASASVSIIEYGDFECVLCGQAHAAIKIILNHFGERVRFAFRHYPQVEPIPMLNSRPKRPKQPVLKDTSGHSTRCCSNTRNI